ncbi:MAG: Cytochrome c biogenesis protein CcsA [Syntrophorhabdaceae bacterium PtaU1.Bin034]|nr:MAG: Cytochrome c biogenesis protein CcsA [Syntrophorhabdaceae bacterium PtaU1.Bin034]
MALNNKILGVVTLLYLCLFVTHLLYFATKKEKVFRVMWIVLYVTFGFHSIGLMARWIESYRLGIGHAPLSNFYESLIFYAWCISLIMIVMKRKLSVPIITMFAALVALFFMGYASLSPSVAKNIQPLIPALQSNWLHVHVFTCFIAYAAFAISFLCGFFYLFRWKGVIPPKETLEEINYQSIMVGFPMLSAGILTGAVWAHYAWGSYWSWDPKETWSLITWIVYALFLHARFARGWRGKRIAMLSIIGFMSVIFTYFGVNFILAGLHSYGAS